MADGIIANDNLLDWVDKAPGHRLDGGLAAVGETRGSYHRGLPQRSGKREAAGCSMQAAGRNCAVVLRSQETTGGIVCSC